MLATLRTCLVAALLIGSPAAAAATADAAPAGDVTRVDRQGACTALPGSGDGGRLTAVPARVEHRMDVGEVALDSKVVLTPTKVDVDRALRPGDAFTCTITVRNRRPAATTFDVVPVGMVGGRDGALRFLQIDDELARATAAPWLDPVQSVVRIPPRGVADIPVVVTVPAAPPVGGAYAAIEIVPRLGTTVRGAGATRVRIDTRAAIAFLLRIGGDGAPQLRLRGEQAPRLRWSRAAWTWRARLENTGTLHATPRGRVRVRSVFGGTVATLDLATPTLLPRARAPLTTGWKHVPWFGVYRYDARVTSGQPTGGATSSGWFLALPPWWVLALIAALVIALVLWRRGSDERWLDDDDDHGFDDDRADLA